MVVVVVVVVVTIVVIIVQLFFSLFFFLSNHSCLASSQTMLSELAICQSTFHNSASIRITSRVNNCQENQEANNTGGDMVTWLILVGGWKRHIHL